jgi:hypothetical protein
MKPSLEFTIDHNKNRIHLWVWNGFMTCVINNFDGFLWRKCNVEQALRLARAYIDQGRIENEKKNEY